MFRRKIRSLIRVLPLMLVVGLTACRTTNPLPPVNLAETGWTIRQGQAVWKPDRRAPEMVGDILVATHGDGRAFVQFTKTPLPFAVAQQSREAWSLEFPLMSQRFAYRGRPPERIIWFQLARHSTGSPIGKSWLWREVENENWHLENRSTGETLEGAFNP